MDQGISRELESRLKYFVLTFTKVYQDKLSKVYNEIKPGGKTEDAGPVEDVFYVAGLGGGAALEATTSVPGSRVIAPAFKELGSAYGKKKHRENSKNVVKAFNNFSPFEVERFRNFQALACDVAVQLFLSFENYFMNVITSDSHKDWQRALGKLAEDAVDRSIYYVAKMSINSSLPDFNPTVDILLEGVLQGESKIGTGTSVHKKLQGIPYLTEIGHHVTYEYNNSKGKLKSVDWTTSDLFSECGLIDSVNQKVLIPRNRKSNIKLYGARRQFFYELDNDMVKVNYIEAEKKFSDSLEVLQSCLRYKYILDFNQLKTLTVQYTSYIFKEISPLKKTQVEDNIEIIKKGIHEVKCLIQEPSANPSIKILNGRKWWPCIKLLPKSFVKRKCKDKDFIQEIFETLNSSELNPEFQTGRYVLSGLGGIGKSTTAKWFANEYESHYNIIFWIDADMNSIHDSLNRLYDALNLNEKDKCIFSVYKRLDGMKCLFVYDNAESYNDANGDFGIKKYLPPLIETQHHVIITSRNRSWGNKFIDGEIPSFHLPLLTQMEALELMKFCLQSQLPKTDETVSKLDEVAKALGYLPVSLHIAIATIRRTSLESYVESLKESLRNIASRKEQLDDYAIPINLSLTITINHVRSNEYLGELSNKLLQICSLIHPDNISENIFYDQLSGWTKSDIKEGFSLLEQYSLLDFKLKGESESVELVENREFYIHRLLQEIIRLDLEKISSKLESIVNDIISSIKGKEKLYELHCATLCENLIKRSEYSRTYSQFIIEVSWLISRSLSITLCKTTLLPSFVQTYTKTEIQLLQLRSVLSMQQVGWLTQAEESASAEAVSCLIELESLSDHNESLPATFKVLQKFNTGLALFYNNKKNDSLPYFDCVKAYVEELVKLESIDTFTFDNYLGIIRMLIYDRFTFMFPLDAVDRFFLFPDEKFLKKETIQVMYILSSFILAAIYLNSDSDSVIDNIPIAESNVRSVMKLLNRSKLTKTQEYFLDCCNNYMLAVCNVSRKDYRTASSFFQNSLKAMFLLPESISNKWGIVKCLVKVRYIFAIRKLIESGLLPVNLMEHTLFQVLNENQNLINETPITTMNSCIIIIEKLEKSVGRQWLESLILST